MTTALNPLALQTLPAIEDWLKSDSQDNRKKVEQRVVGQLLQTLLYEEVLSYQYQALTDDQGRFLVEGVDAQDQTVQYACLGLRSASFDLIRLDYHTLERTDAVGEVSTPSLHQALAELLHQVQDSPYLPRFIDELEQTLIKDLQSRSLDYQLGAPAHQLDAEALEQHFMDAHSYHPCYKSRIGFSLTENLLYGPEFAMPIHPVWLAISKSCSVAKVSEHLETATFLQDEFGEQRWQQSCEQLRAKGKQPEDYWLLPVHPWQWEHVIMSAFSAELISEELIYLGESSERYQAQQSLRTLQNMTDIQRPYIKLAMSMTNTSSTRILAKHTVLNGPIINNWLQQLIRQDATAQALGFVILGEIAGVSFAQEHLPQMRKPQTYGALGAIWRESIHQYLNADEQAVPFNGLSHLENEYRDAQVEPFIAPWIEQYGLKAWTQQLLQVCVPPIIHMLYAEGVGMESHGQNIVLIHKDGWPQRIALKDFHDGVRYSPQHLGHPELAPELAEVPASHAKLNSNSFIITDDVNAVRDFSCDCFFFICLSDLAIFLRQHYQLAEPVFWQMVAQVILDYQTQHPEHAERYALFDLFASHYEVEELTKRRLLGDGERRFKQVPNPLHSFGPASC